jgi:undecaprenyl pyrophosphate phosphatase UppP
MSIPASLGAALFVGVDRDSIGLTEGFVGAVVSAGVGLASIKALLAVAHRANFAAFVAAVGVAVIAGGIVQVVWF